MKSNEIIKSVQAMQKQIDQLQASNTRLKELLKAAGINYMGRPKKS